MLARSDWRGNYPIHVATPAFLPAEAIARMSRSPLERRADRRARQLSATTQTPASGTAVY
jgi:hypothetical protein